MCRRVYVISLVYRIFINKYNGILHAVCEFACRMTSRVNKNRISGGDDNFLKCLSPRNRRIIDKNVRTLSTI